MAALLDQTTQVAPTVGVVFDEQNFHGLRKNCLNPQTTLGRPLRVAEMGEWLACSFVGAG